MTSWHLEKRRDHPRGFLPALERALGLIPAGRTPPRRRAAHGKRSGSAGPATRTKM
jgi:hypothetical protein